MPPVGQRAGKAAIRGSTESQTVGGSTQLPQIGSFLTVNRVFEEHLRLRDTSDEPALDLRQSAPD